MEQSRIDRINELAHKSKAEGLTPEEKAEQAELRKEFLAAIRADLKRSLDSIEFVDDDKKTVVTEEVEISETVIRS